MELYYQSAIRLHGVVLCYGRVSEKCESHDFTAVTALIDRSQRFGGPCDLHLNGRDTA